MIQAIEIKTPDGVCDAWIARPEAQGETKNPGQWPAIIFCMDAVGPRPVLKAMAERLASNGFVVLLPNLFYRDKPAPLVTGIDFPVAAENIPEVLKQIMPLVQRFDPAAALQDMKIFSDYLIQQSNVSPGKFGIFGYCMGGSMAIRTAAQYPDRFAAVASFHAGGLVSDDANSPHRLLSKLRATLYVAHADQDPHMNPEQIKEFEKAVTTLSISHQVEFYTDAHHHFTMKDLPAYNPAAAEKAWTKLVQLFQTSLHPSSATQ